MSINDGGPPAWIWGGLVALATGALAVLLREQPKRVFVSYDYDNDRRYKDLLAAWNANRRFSFVWEDHSTKRIDSREAGPIKAAITRRLKEADILLVLIGERTADSAWVAWEIQRAKDLGLDLVGVKLKKTFISPPELLSSGASWAASFSEKAIVDALGKLR